MNLRASLGEIAVIIKKISLFLLEYVLKIG